MKKILVLRQATIAIILVNLYSVFCISEVNNGENEAFSIAEDVIFNPELDGVEEFVNVITFGNPAEGKY